MAPIQFSTGDIRENYEIIDVIFAGARHTEGFFSLADPGKAFQVVTSKLSKACQSLGGNAVIFCQFKYRDAVAPGGVFSGPKHAVELFAFGTAVRFK
jgi:hypothetical protein